MEAVYQWIQQIAVFAVISFLILYLMGSWEKKFTLRFYLSLLMLILILRPVSNYMDLETVMTEKMAKLETDAEISVVSDQIQEIKEQQNYEFLDETSQLAMDWIKGFVQDMELDFLEGEIYFDEKILEQTGEVVVSEVEIIVSEAGMSSTEIKPVLKRLKEKIADTFDLKESSVIIKSRKIEK